MHPSRLNPAVLSVAAFTALALSCPGAPPHRARVGPIRGGEAARRLELDLTGQQTLVLEAKGYSWGQAVWGEGRLIKPDGSAVKLSDLTPDEFHVSWGKFQKNSGPDGKPLRVGGSAMSDGLFAHADSRVVYLLGGEYARFQTQVGINHTAATRGSVVFTATALPTDYAAYRRVVAARRELAPESLAALEKSLQSLQRLRPHDADLYRRCREQLARIRKQGDDLLQHLDRGDSEAIEAAATFAAVRRAALCSVIDAPLLFVKRHAYMAGHIYDDYLTWRPGGGIYVLENPADPPEKHIVRAVIDPTTTETLGEGVYRDPDLSWDASRVLFAFKDGASGNTSLYEIGIDGKGLRQITNPGEDCACRKPEPGLVGKGQHDVTPCYLPNGRIAFTSTRTGGHVMCFSSYIDVLHTVNGNGTDLKSISVNNVNEFDPAVLPDGRILYGRWEYVDKTALYMQSLWTVRPDGTHETALFANNLAKPTAVLDARPVPGSDLIVAALTPHNGQAVGAIAMIDPKAGKNSLEAITNFTPEYPTEMDQGLRQGPSDPWPLSEDFVLIANNAKQVGPHGVLQLIDRFGSRVVLHREPGISCYAPIPVKPRARPAVQRSDIRPGEPARFVVHDVYRGMAGVERGIVRRLRVLETTSRVSGIPKGGRWWNQAFLTSWQGSYDVKRFLGSVPVEPDGSAYFEVPTGKALYFQALDKDNRLVQSMRSFVQAAPGITRSCTGCHVDDEDEAPQAASERPMALRRSASKLEAESWGAGFLDYARHVQPVLDRHCVGCHGGDDGMAAGLDLTGGWTWAFNISYETLIKNTLAGFLNCHNGAVRTAELLPPKTHGSAVAPLAHVLVGGHKKRISKMTQAETDLLLAWMDGNGNYFGTWDYTEHATCNALPATRVKLLAEMERGGCLRCHHKEIGNDWVNLRTPERSRILRAPMAAGTGLGLGWCRERKARSPDRAFVTTRQQPPDVFRPSRKPKADPSGDATVALSGTNAPAYKAMLTIITEAREQALKTPRVDMPGAEIIPGKCRELPPLSPPMAARHMDGPAGGTGKAL